jgi:iron-sulfur cluster assembly protein
MLTILDEEPAPASAPPGATFTLTASAAKKVSQLLVAEQAQKPVKALRVGVRGGGCSGLQYFMEFTDASEDGDHVFETGGVTYYVDDRSLAVLNGGSLDFASTLRESGFKWINPNEKKSCGCGESFSV